MSVLTISMIILGILGASPFVFVLLYDIVLRLSVYCVDCHTYRLKWRMKHYTKVEGSKITYYEARCDSCYDKKRLRLTLRQ